MSSKDEIIEKLTRIVEEHLRDEQFGVEELADQMGVSRSTLLRTIKKHTSLSANQFIKDIRLEHARLRLSETDDTVAEVAYQTGFSSPSYFIKCFKEKYGYSPGEHRSSEEKKEDISESDNSSNHMKWILGGAVIILVVLSIIFFGNDDKKPAVEPADKSIAVLPFKNESADSTNLYFVNGMMESILNHLQKIEDLRVISRTSVEKYRDLQMTMPEIAEELGVNYIVEGSGQKHGNSILLTVQLIAANEDRHLWSEQYSREFSDVFTLQANVSKKIAGSIEAVIRPEEIHRIEAIPTDNFEAYDLYLYGKEFLKEETEQALDSALVYFEQAIQLDENFAHPYAYAAICYYYKDFMRTEKQHLEELGNYSDKALLIDGELPEALISRGLYYMQMSKIHEAKEYFEKVLTYNPNSAWTHNFLSEIYNTFLPDTEKYLIHSLSALQLDLSKSDSMDVSNTHLIIANAFSQSGMMGKAKEHIEISLDYNPRNIFSAYVEIYIDLTSDFDMEKARSRMIKVWMMDTTRLDVLKELGKICYSQQDYGAAAKYYGKFLDEKTRRGYNLFPSEDVTMAYVFREVGDKRADSLRNSYEAFANADQSIYGDLMRCFLYLYDGETERALNSLEAFSRNENYIYWILLMLEGDPMIESVNDQPKFKSIIKKMNGRFEAKKSQRTKKLREMGLI